MVSTKLRSGAVLFPEERRNVAVEHKSASADIRPMDVESTPSEPTLVSTNFNVHAMFGWSHSEDMQTVVHANDSTKLARLRLFYEKTEVFVTDEVNAMSNAELGLLDETMSKVFDPDRQQRDSNGR